MKLLTQGRRFLRKPYPFYYQGKDLWLLLLLVGLMSVVFLFFFKPFDVNVDEHKMSFFAISIMHTAVGVLVLLLCALGLRIFQVRSDMWTVGKDIAFLTVVLIVIGVGQYLIRDLIYDNPNNWSLQYLSEEVRNAFMIGILFILILVPLNHNRLQAKNARRAMGIHNLQPTVTRKQPLFIKTQLKQDDFTLEPSEFLFAIADRNYVEIHTLQNGALQKSLKRISLRSLERQLDPISHILRTHRSYLVNLQYLESISGNAQGYHLKMRHSDVAILVSRTLIPDFEERLGQVS